MRDGHPDDRPRGVAIPPPPPAGKVEGSSAIEGVGVIVELEETLALCLWRAIRDVRLFLETPREALDSVFAETTAALLDRYAAAAAQAPELADALGALLSIRRTPALVSRSAIARACAAIAGWAEQANLLQTGAAYAEAAAVADADDAGYALQAARLTRRLALHERAPTWYKRAYLLALQRRDREIAVRALLGHGAWYRDVGEHDEAGEMFRRAARRAVYSGPRRLAAEAVHELMNLASERGEEDQASLHAWEALRLYSKRSGRIPYLAHDFALHLVRSGFHKEARMLLERLVSRFDKREESVLLWATYTWTLGHVGTAAELANAETKVLSLAAWVREYEGAVFLHLANAFHAAGDRQRAALYATQALASAARVSDLGVEKQAAALVSSLAAGAPPTPRTRTSLSLVALVRAFLARL